MKMQVAVTVLGIVGLAASAKAGTVFAFSQNAGVTYQGIQNVMTFEKDDILLTVTANGGPKLNSADTIHALVNFTSDSLGIKSNLDANATAQNRINVGEYLWLNFDKPVTVSTSLFLQFSTVNDSAKFYDIDGSEITAVRDGTGYSLYYAGGPIGITAATGDFKLSRIDVSLDAPALSTLPLPAGAWSGLGLLGVLAGRRYWKKRK